MRFPELAGKVVVITGAGSNIGREIALAFAEEAANVVICDIDAALAEQTNTLIRDAGGKSSVTRADMCKAADVEGAAKDIIDRYRRIDIWINNAGITQPGQDCLADVSEATFDKIISINLKGVWLGMKYAIPQMLAQGNGVIVNTSSVRGLTGGAGRSIYSASKHGIIGLTKSAALEYGPKGIRINAVCPGLMEGAMINPSANVVAERAATTMLMNPATQRAGRAEEVVAAILFLCSEGASNIHGIALPVDGGYMAG